MSVEVKEHEAISVESLGAVSVESQQTIKRAYRKIDFIILPLLFLGFFGLQLDRGNIANAITDTLLQDLKITTDTINVGTQLLSAGIIIFEIPSNMILQRIGARRWITGQIIAWGLVSSLQCFVKKRSTFLLTRFILGACEAGFIPGTLYYLSTWYRKDQYAKRNTIFFLGNQLGTACSGLLAAGILRLAGKNGLAGWRWLFLIDGIITMFIGVLWLIFLPESPQQSSSIVFPRWKLLDEQSSLQVTEHLLEDDSEKVHARISIKPINILQVLSNWRLWQHIMVTFLPMAATSMSTYFPTIVKQLGYTKYQANAMSSIGWFIAIPFQLALAYYSDITSHRGVAVIIPQALASIFIGVMFGVDTAKSKFVLIVLSQMTFYSFHVLNVTWTSANCISPIERSISLAAVVMSANLSQLAGAPIFGQKYAPGYRVSFIVSLTLMCLGTAFSSLVAVGYFYSNRKLTPNNKELSSDDESLSSSPDVSVATLRLKRRLRGVRYVW